MQRSFGYAKNTIEMRFRVRAHIVFVIEGLNLGDVLESWMHLRTLRDRTDSVMHIQSWLK